MEIQAYHDPRPLSIYIRKSLSSENALVFSILNSNRYKCTLVAACLPNIDWLFPQQTALLTMFTKVRVVPLWKKAYYHLGSFWCWISQTQLFSFSPAARTQFICSNLGGTMLIGVPNYNPLTCLIAGEAILQRVESLKSCRQFSMGNLLFPCPLSLSGENLDS